MAFFTTHISYLVKLRDFDINQSYLFRFFKRDMIKDIVIYFILAGELGKILNGKLEVKVSKVNGIKSQKVIRPPFQKESYIDTSSA